MQLLTTKIVESYIVLSYVIIRVTFGQLLINEDTNKCLLSVYCRLGSAKARSLAYFEVSQRQKGNKSEDLKLMGLSSSIY